MTQRLDALHTALEAALGERIRHFQRERGEITITVAAADAFAVATLLRDDPALAFEQLIDLCGVDYSAYKDLPSEGPRFCVVSHLLSLSRNWRLRLKVFAPDDDLPVVASLTPVWSSANWYEREAFDTRCARTSPSPATSRCATTKPRSGWSTSRSRSSRARSPRA